MNSRPPTAGWVHAYFHRKNGDASNAAYWYPGTGKPAYTGSPDDEWIALTTHLLTP